MPDPKAVSILIVDDDLGLLRLVQMALKREGFAASTASSGREAIDWLTGHRADLMLLDLKLHDIGGRELVSHLAEVEKPVPFIIITGQGDERVAVDMMKRGALDYLVKDIQFIEFVPTVVRRALEQVEKDKKLVAAQQALRESQEQLLAISEREQRRFGAELHDGLGQQLTAIELRCQSLKEDLRHIRSGLSGEISQICQFLREAIAQTRAMAHGLSPVNFDAGGLAEALRELALRMSEGKRLRCTFRLLSAVTRGDTSVAGHLYRIAQEAVNNAVKHSRADEVSICLGQKNGRLRLEIVDDGRGFPKSPKKSRGIGLQMMKHRAGVMGGELEIRTEAGKGVTLICTVPTKKQ